MRCFVFSNSRLEKYCSAGYFSEAVRWRIAKFRIRGYCILSSGVIFFGKEACVKTEDAKPQDAPVDKTIQLDTDSIDRLARFSKVEAGAHGTAPEGTAPFPSATERSGNLTRSFFRRKISVHEIVVEQHFNDDSEAAEVLLTPVPENALPDIDRSYRVESLVAQGGHGKISLCEDRILARKVAVKSLLDELETDPELRSRFVIEAKVTSQLDHPSIPPVHGLFGDSRRRLHMVMKMIHGMTLTDYLDLVRLNYSLDGVKKFDVRKDLFERLNIFRRICFAMEYAHEHHVVHCDLKPDNIMIGRYNETYIMDWGIARTREGVLARNPGGKLSGTPRFLSPEAVSGDESWKDDPKLRAYGWMSGDIYALGLILFELTTLSIAYGGKSSSEILQRVARSEMEPIVSRFGCRIDGDLKAIIRKATASDLRLRYHSVRALDEDIAKYLRSEAVSARPDNLPRKIVRWAGRHVRVLLFAVLLAMLVASYASSFVIYSRLEAAEQERRISLAASRAIQVGEKLDSQFDKLNIGLWAQGMEARHLLTTPKAFLPPFPSHAREIGGGSADAAPYKTGTIDPEHIYYLRAPGLDPAAAKAELGKLTQLEDGFRRFVLESNDLGAGGNPAELKERLRDSRLLVSRIFFGLEDGLHLVYPRNLDYPEDFDPRLRDWYLETPATPVQPGVPYWLCYQDVSLKRRILAARVEVSNHVTGEKLGVMAFDIPVERLYQLLREQNPGRKKFGVLINDEGRIMPEDGGEPGAVHPAYDEISKREFGRCRAADGKIYIFAKLKAPGWFYVEQYIP